MRMDECEVARRRRSAVELSDIMPRMHVCRVNSWFWVYERNLATRSTNREMLSSGP